MGVSLKPKSGFGGVCAMAATAKARAARRVKLVRSIGHYSLTVPLREQPGSGRVAGRRLLQSEIPMVKTERELRDDICQIGRLVFEKGWVAANDGNITIRMDAERILATPTGV